MLKESEEKVQLLEKYVQEMSQTNMGIQDEVKRLRMEIDRYRIDILRYKVENEEIKKDFTCVLELVESN